MNILLDDVEIRVLGSLVEKEVTTPDYYPLSLNALLNACNQKSNRHPAMTLDEDAVREALDTLNAKGLAGAASHADSRVTKYEHRLQETFNFSRPETAVLCVLLLRGPQTPGELRGRTERLHRFGGLDEVLSALQHLMNRQPSLVKVLPRQPGTKEARYAHLLSGDVETWEPARPAGGPEPAAEAASSFVSPDTERITRLENEVEGLQKEITNLKQQLAEFRKQFE